MKKILILITFLLSIGLFGCEINKQNQTEEEFNKIETTMNDYIDMLIAATPSYIPSWNQEGYKGRWNYIDGVFLNSIVNLYEQTQEEKYKEFFINYVNYYINVLGLFVNPESKENGFKSGELDSICASKILFDAYKYTDDPRYMFAIDTTYKQLNKIPKAEGSNNFWHKTTYPNQIWLDGMYMYAPFYARYAKENLKEEIFGEITSQYKYIRDNMFDENYKLYYHGHDTTRSIFWADKVTGNSENFWLRSMGWYMVSLIDVLDYFPEGNDKEYLTGLLIEGIDGILKYLNQETKMFYQLVNLGEYSQLVTAKYLSTLKNKKYMINGEYVDTYISNYLESSGSSMISYCLLKGSRIGLLKNEYHKLGEQIFEGIYNHSFKKNQLHDICITAGLGPESNTIRDGSISYYLAEPVGTNDAKGIGPFIMAYLEYIR